MKFVHKFYNRLDIPWINLVWGSYYASGQIPHWSPEKGSFWWKDVTRLISYFRGYAMPHVGDGSTILLWEDVWNDLSPMTAFPCLFSFAKNKECSVQTFLGNTAMEDNFHTPLSLQAAQEYETFIVIIDQMMASREDSDRWIYPWGNSKFSSLKFYKLNFGSIEPPPFMWIWQSKVCKKINFFVWLVFRDRINSKNLLKRKGFLNAASDLRCVLCDSNCEETTFHLLFE